MLPSGERDQLVTVKVHLPAQLVAKIQAYAERHDEAISHVIEQALTRALRCQRL